MAPYILSTGTGELRLAALTITSVGSHQGSRMVAKSTFIQLLLPTHGWNDPEKDLLAGERYRISPNPNDCTSEFKFLQSPDASAPVWLGEAGEGFHRSHDSRVSFTVSPGSTSLIIKRNTESIQLQSFFHFRCRFVEFILSEAKLTSIYDQDFIRISIGICHERDLLELVALIILKDAEVVHPAIIHCWEPHRQGFS
jgi:hypothetical protein